MHKHTPRLLARAIIAALTLLSAGACAKKDNAPIALFNGADTTGWIAHGPDTPPGAAATWSAANGVLAATGAPFGYLRTETRHSNYRLTVEWRWPAAAQPDANGNPRPRNSGVFLHMQGGDKVWPTCVEAQLQEQNAGDFIFMGVAGASELNAARTAAIAAAGNDSVARKKAETNRRIPRKNPSSEKPAGEWNRLDIVCDGGTITVSVNGVEQNRATGVTVSEGHICLQSEGAPVEFRNVTLTELRKAK